MRDPLSALAETLSHLDALLAEGQSRDDVLDVERLSVDSGVPREVIETLLDGKEPPAEDITDRIIRRFEHLRETRRRDDGQRRSYGEIAASFGASRASLSNLVNSRKKAHVGEGAGGGEPRTVRSGGPLAATQAGIEEFFFGAPNGWLSAEPASALDDALQPVLAELRAAAGEDPLARLRHAHGLRRIAHRAAELSDAEQELVADWIDTILRRRDQEKGPKSPETP
ncbi:hypothetical protein [Streptomyces ureilyticus]|uniref:Transcriptional regulator n=1 Tax=Streptomyces ureilyticus TaxID=1775131 RepID=A0ABX0DKJ8_9ACTN|nr:hypothetical protein [Streptomyces ureilyticus]NGO41264.1 hypothetical protein [Streptomyces ureilyticus]